MSKRLKSLAGATAAMSVLALASTGALASGNIRHPYETCLTEQALALELSRNETSEVVAEAERACSDKKGQLSNAAVSEVAQKVRLAVMQQRSNARNLERRPL
jgi:hypothetical protein